jgi:rubrerythrin/DNA-directed RNA polymerase subunit RPC12/RpoP
MSEEKMALACEHCGAEADLVLEGMESVEKVIERERGVVCPSCGQEIVTGVRSRETLTCSHCGAEADLTVEGFEQVEDVLRREGKLACSHCGKEVAWTGQESAKAVRMAMQAEREAFLQYLKASRKTRDPRGREMFKQLSGFEVNHYRKLRSLSKSLQEKGEWIVYDGTSLEEARPALKAEKLSGSDQLNDLDALTIAIGAEKKAQTYYRTMAELTGDSRGKEMFRRLAEEEALHEKLLNDQYYTLHNTGYWSWGD